MDNTFDKTTGPEINWHEYNYPPLVKLMHFRPSELAEDRKPLVMQLFMIHIAVLLNTILNIIANCIEGGLNILYAFLFFFIFNPIVLFLFYRGYIGLCKEKSKLGLYIYIQPLVIIIEIIISIVNFLGFNGFIRVAKQFQNKDHHYRHHSAAGVFGLIISIGWIGIAVWSGYIYFRIFKERSILTKALL